MVEIPRETFKKDPVWNALYKVIKKGHKPAQHTKKILNKNRKIKDFCEESIHFLVLDNKIFLQYKVASWIKGREILVKFESIGVYESFMEFEKAKNESLYSAKDADIPNQN